MSFRVAWAALAGLAGLHLATTCAAGEDPVTALLRHQTDVGSEAGQRGDQATVNSFLDDEVLFSGGDGAVGRDE